MPDPDPLIRLLVADDHPVVRKGLVMMLQSDARMQVVAEADNGRDAVELYAQVKPDVVLLDLRMPKMGGAEAIAAICAHDPHARIVIVTAVDGEEDIYRGLRAGARGYVLKDAPGAEIVEAVVATMQGRRYLTNAVADRLVDRLTETKLSTREMEILRLMATGISNKGIARTAGITEGTVKFHVNNILAKLGCGSRTEAVASALKRRIIELGA